MSTDELFDHIAYLLKKGWTLDEIREGCREVDASKIDQEELVELSNADDYLDDMAHILRVPCQAVVSVLSRLGLPIPRHSEDEILAPEDRMDPAECVRGDANYLFENNF